ncbi:hypothetical protein CIHG_04104 [Coccidioides immitis H538.4]|uniref:Uncharacterized protein n=3 Tax=Coccidioides immitis TaxID=5501 RepID=A0A0J8R0X5_COCIT|nr:hypothetical protein CIRG_04502 [Coccidioides immitis RMSCC 2394]KMU78386.1 hypothetical protein CISG_07103 [Coccidioides immitis RMSCC 3703]KMU86315.1 hypothetical protein CIHG_04104 [Coccidioides immitis H538.4]
MGEISTPRGRKAHNRMMVFSVQQMPFISLCLLCLHLKSMRACLTLCPQPAALFKGTGGFRNATNPWAWPAAMLDLGGLIRRIVFPLRRAGAREAEGTLTVADRPIRIGAANLIVTPAL